MVRVRDSDKNFGNRTTRPFKMERACPTVSHHCPGETNDQTQKMDNTFRRKFCGLAFNTTRVPQFLSRNARDVNCCTTMKTAAPRPRGRTLFSIAACSSVLGPLLDNYHSQFGILAYKNPVEIHLSVAGIQANFATTLFTPPLFVLAGLIIAYGTLRINKTFVDRSLPLFPVTGPQAMAGIAAFSSIYYLSAAIPNSEFRASTGPVLTLLAFAEWYFMDRSIGGMVMGGLAGLCGPLVEVGLINIGGLYSYASPEVFGIPLFIGAVYFAGGSAVGNLARAIDVSNESEMEKSES